MRRIRVHLSLQPRCRSQAPRLVIYQPRTICAEAIEAAVHAYTRWHVTCVTTNVGVATAAALACDATALLFDTRSGSPMSVAALIRRLRSACPHVPLILLTAHEGKGFLKTAAAATLSAIVLKRESVAVLRAALEAVGNERACPKAAPYIACERGHPLHATTHGTSRSR